VPGERAAPAALLMTATITPDASVPMLKVRDPETRLREYARSLDFYLGFPDVLDRIVLAENSGSDLTALESVAKRKGAAHRFEALHVDPTPAELGRGVGEAQIVRQAMASSTLLADLSDAQHVWKVTGRYILRNIAQLAATAPPSAVYINVRRRPRLWCDTYAYAFTRSGYERHLAGAAEAIAGEAGTGPLGEESMARMILGLIDQGADIVPRFRYEPRLEGTRGVDLTAHTDPKQRLKYVTRVVARRLAPGLWI
jgi:hypothetical protein